VYLPFKENRSVAAEEANAQVSGSAIEDAAEAGRRLVYCVFDITYVRGPGTDALLRSHGVKEVPVTSQSHGGSASAGGSITHLDLRTRRALLEAVVKQRAGKLELMMHEVIEDVHEPKRRQERLMAIFDRALQVALLV
jgi:ATP-dependent DNA ligase